MSGEHVIIDGLTYSVPVIGVKRTADALDAYAKRTEDGILRRKLIGIYFGYTMKFGVTTNREEYERLWKKLTEPVEFHTVIVPDESGLYTFIAYFSSIGDELLRIYNEKNYWENLTVKFTGQSPARKPA